MGADWSEVMATWLEPKTSPAATQLVQSSIQDDSEASQTGSLRQAVMSSPRSSDCRNPRSPLPLPLPSPTQLLSAEFLELCCSSSSVLPVRPGCLWRLTGWRACCHLSGLPAPPTYQAQWNSGKQLSRCAVGSHQPITAKQSSQQNKQSNAKWPVNAVTYRLLFHRGCTQRFHDGLASSRWLKKNSKVLSENLTSNL